MQFSVLNFFKNKIVWLIIILSFVLRFWGLGGTPPSLYWDEVSQGYNAYSILKTGRDEHHEFMPLARFQAFGDYKAPVYIYLDVLPIALLGQSEFAVRLPSAFFGTLTVVVAYFLVLELFFDNKRKKAISILTTFFLAISPWHIQLSRVAYEANIATFFTILGIFLFLYSIRKRSYWFVGSVISFVVAFYSFNAHRIFVPLIFLFAFLINFREIISRKKIIIVSCLIGFLLLLPFLIYFRSPESRLRFNEVNIFSDISQIELSNRLTKDDNSIIGKVIHNRRVLYLLSYIKHYFDFQNPTYLFFKGDENPRFSTQQNGELYLFMLPLILIGIYKILKTERKSRIFILGWFLLAPLAGATARETPHALRSETFLPLYEIFAGFGTVFLYDFISKLKKYWVKWLLVLFFFLVILYQVIDFLHMYYVHLPNRYSQDFQYGYKQVIERVEKVKNDYDKIVFTNTYGRAYVYVLWYGHYTPQDFWIKGRTIRDTFGFYNVDRFGKYVFISPDKYKKMAGEKILYVGLISEIPKDSIILDRVNFLDGSSAFVVAKSL